MAYSTAMTEAILQQLQQTLSRTTDGQGLYEMTREISDWTEGQDIETCLLTIYCRHTSASLVIPENADPDVMRDLQSFFKALVPKDTCLYRHSAEGADDMPAHIKGALTATSLGIPVTDGRLALGTWQGIYLFEHRFRPHRRDIVLHLQGT